MLYERRCPGHLVTWLLCTTRCRGPRETVVARKQTRVKKLTCLVVRLGCLHVSCTAIPNLLDKPPLYFYPTAGLTTAPMKCEDECQAMEAPHQDRQGVMVASTFVGSWKGLQAVAGKLGLHYGFSLQVTKVMTKHGTSTPQHVQQAYLSSFGICPPTSDISACPRRPHSCTTRWSACSQHEMLLPSSQMSAQDDR